VPLKQFNPTSPGRRGMTGSTFDEITTNRPYKPLVQRLKSTGGRNNQGRITTRHRGGGTYHHYRVIDFKRNKLDVAGKVIGIEYDPNRSARIALIEYADGEKRYILAPLGLKLPWRQVRSCSVTVAQQVRADREEAERQLTVLRERMQHLARRAAGITEPESTAESRAWRDYKPILRGGF